MAISQSAWSFERYRDSEAAIEHAKNLGHMFAAVRAAVSIVHGEVVGEPNAELRAYLAGSEVRFCSRRTALGGRASANAPQRILARARATGCDGRRGR